MDQHDFGWALARMREGREVRRDTDHPGWAGVRVGINPPHKHLTSPYVYLASMAGTVPWTPGQWDLLAEDWAVAP